MNLILSDTDHLNATYTQEDGTPMYQVTTPFSLISPTATIERAISGFEQGTAAAFTAHHRYEFLAQVEFHTWSSSILRIEREEVKTSVFFTEGGFTLRETLGSSRKFIGPDGKEYKWILNPKTPTLVLNDAARTFVAKLHIKHYGIFHKARPAFLEISPLGMHMVDLILITFVYIEKLVVPREGRSEGMGVSSDMILPYSGPRSSVYEEVGLLD
ncbi:hypothetical protein BDN72DRAFT_901481 [Pluteus cervinus]|uniref:Uncharacterized protein n=1 Tax=Pluteus cervinus TaxID=181527 RepID=A0ACD3AF19_9AGAR|nr:hypothetical protein BDN72DRAFT_901481 [Pluteus cervinus]